MCIRDSAWTSDLPLVLSVSGYIRIRHTNGRIDGTDQPLLCVNAPGISGRYAGVGDIPGIDRTGL